MARPLTDRLWSRVEQADSGCWEFTGAHSEGYGRISGPGGRLLYTHRLAFELLVGPIPAGLDIDHLCRNRICCNPAHLEPVTRRTNLLRGDTLAAAHAADRDCGFTGCNNCRRFHVEAAS